MSINCVFYFVKKGKSKMTNLTLIEKLQKVYDANIDVPNENFDMCVWKIETSCGTTACMIGNAIIYDPYFKNNGLCFSKNNNIEYITEEQTCTRICALSKFFGISHSFAEIIFLPEVHKKEILKFLEKVIEFLKNNPNGKMWELLDYLRNEYKHILEYIIEFNEDELKEYLDDELDEYQPLYYFDDLIQMFKSKERNCNYLYDNHQKYIN